MEYNFVFGCVLVFFWTQNQVLQITMELGWWIYHIKTLLVLIRNFLKIWKCFLSVDKNRFEMFDFSPYFERKKRASSLIMA